jgi:hypothetical protein
MVLFFGLFNIFEGYMKSYNIIRYLSYLLLLSNLCLAQILYVDDDASSLFGTGQSWSDAYRYLQDALSYASAGDEVHVAQGIYKPDLGAGKTQLDRYATFNLINGVAILGGYAGIGCTDPNERDVEIYTSVLDGDLLNDDTGEPYDVNRYNNTYNIISAINKDSTAIIDGFMVMRAMAHSNYPQQRVGGGLYNKGGNPTVLNCTFINNDAKEYGGGLYNESGSPLIYNCTFTENTAPCGGGVANYSGSARFENCLLIQNQVTIPDADGGGFYNYSGTPVFINCTFIENNASGYLSGGTGAGGYIKAGQPTIINSRFLKNTAQSAGGALYIRTGQLTVINSIFSGNVAGGGGAIMTSELASVLI